MDAENFYQVWQSVAMSFGAAFSAVTALVLGYSARNIRRQLVISNDALKLSNHVSERNQLLYRRDLYSTTTELPEEYIASSLIHWRDHFDEEVYQEHYQGDSELRVRRRHSYLLMKRKYMYLLFQWKFDDEFENATRRWLKELAEYREFRHVHEAHKGYYPEFYDEIETMIGEPEKNLPWMCEDSSSANEA